MLEKKRVGSRTIKKYERAKTPYQRVIESNHISHDIKDELIKQYNNLDPIVLKEQIKVLQDQLWKHAWTGPITPAVDEVEVNMGNSPEVQLIEPRRYRKTKKPSRKHDWRTRKDPFEDAREFIELQLNANIPAKEILRKLIKKYPNNFYKGHLRTLQKRVSELRTQQNNREQKYKEQMVSKKLMTTEVPLGNICI